MENKCGIERIWTGVDPFPKDHSSGFCEGLFQKSSVFKRQHPPSHHSEKLVDLAKEPVGDHCIETLAVVIDNPPSIAQFVLPAFVKCFVDITFIEFGVPNEGNHTSFWGISFAKGFQSHIVLNQAGKCSNCDPESD